MSEDIAPLIVDLGSSKIRAGFSANESPNAVFPSVVATGDGETKVGDEAVSARDRMKLVRAIVAGESNWLLHRILRHTFRNEMCVNTEEHPVRYPC